MDDLFLDRQKLYWNTLAREVPDKIALNHWVDENDNPLDEKLFFEIAVFLNNEFLSYKNNGKILEIGCGNGMILQNLLKILNYNDWKLHGCDLSDEMLSRIKQKEIVLYNCDATKIPCENNQFDLIYMHGVIQYFANEKYLEDTLRECMRILKDSGCICLMDVPSIWYKDLMMSRSIKSQLRREIKDFIDRHYPALISIYRSISKRKTIVERVGGVSIDMPYFQGFWADPDYFYKYRQYFNKVSIEVQPFAYKPINYRKFRFNILFRQRNNEAFTVGGL
jgi:ubiquinone/menaquinone biosynthesis C-methylase UbiE